MAVVYVALRTCTVKSKQQQQPLLGIVNGALGSDSETHVRLEHIYPQDDKHKKFYGSL